MSPHLRCRFATVALVCAPVIALAREGAGRIENRFEKPPEPKSTLQPLLILLQKQAGQKHFAVKELTLVAYRTAEQGGRQWN